MFCVYSNVLVAWATFGGTAFAAAGIRAARASGTASSRNRLGLNT
jgi:hypothetical protein